MLIVALLLPMPVAAQPARSGDVSAPDAAARRIEADHALARPSLPAAQNRLLGRWRGLREGGPPRGDWGRLVTTLTDESCGLLLRGTMIEFGETRIAMADEAGAFDAGAVAYRVGPDGVVFAVPEASKNVMAFTFESDDRVRLVGHDCVLERVPGSPAIHADPGSTPTQGK